MNQVSKAEQLRLPEQLYILLTDPNTGEPRYGSQRVERVLSISIIWELLNSGAFATNGNQISAVNNAIFDESYLRRAALAASGLVPIDGREFGWVIASNLHPVWKTIGEDMLAKHLLTEEVQTRFVFFHQRVLAEMAEARIEAAELSASLAQAARNLWDASYDAELAHSHPRLLARLVLLDNFGLLLPLIGGTAYASAAPYMSDIRTHLHTIVQDTRASRPRAASSDSTYYSSDSGSCGVYDSGADFWIFGSEDHHHDSHGGSHDSHGGHDGNDSSGSHDGGGDSGGGDCGGCGGCGG